MSSDPRQPVAVIGAGPYGLAAATHLRALQVPTHVFGDPMQYWREHMPEGMRLRSSWTASSIASPDRALSLARFESERGARLERPVPLADFLDYAEWYRQAGVPECDPRRVLSIDLTGGRFRISLADGDELSVPRVVLATGLHEFSRRPAEFASLAPTLVSHTADHPNLAGFAGRRLIVIGAGQSAIESAVLAHEAGAQVHVLARAPGVHWLTRSARLHGGSAVLGRVLYAPTDVGPAGLSWMVAAPRLMRRLPHGLRRRIIRRCLRPAASDWLAPRSEGMTITCGRSVARAEPAPDAGVSLTLDDHSRLTGDHVLLGTGFRPDLASVSILAPGLRNSIEQREGQPRLRSGFETSVPGLHIVGALSASSYGPVMRFVSGTWSAAPELARHLAQTRPV